MTFRRQKVEKSAIRGYREPPRAARLHDVLPRVVIITVWCGDAQPEYKGWSVRTTFPTYSGFTTLLCRLCELVCVVC